MHHCDQKRHQVFNGRGLAVYRIDMFQTPNVSLLYFLSEGGKCFKTKVRLYSVL